MADRADGSGGATTAALVELAAGYLGDPVRVLAHRRGEQARSWRVRGPVGVAWIKRHDHEANAAREATALTTVGPTLGASVPRVLARLRGDALLLSEVPGVPVSSTTLDAASRASGWRAVARWLRRLATCPVEATDPVEPATAYARRFDGWLSRLRDPTVISVEALRARFDPTVFAGATRRWCHRDLTPDNILVDAGDEIGVIDFGQARPDVWPLDLVKLDCDRRLSADDRRVLRDELELTARDEARLDALRLLHGLQTLAWGQRHHDAARRDEGIAILAAATAQPRRPG